MPHLYFDFESNRTRFIDEDGFDCPNLESGRREVLRTLAEIAKDALPGSDEQTFRGTVRDDTGRIAYTATVSVTGTWHVSALDR